MQTLMKYHPERHFVWAFHCLPKHLFTEGIIKGHSSTLQFTVRCLHQLCSIVFACLDKKIMDPLNPSFRHEQTNFHTLFIHTKDKL